MTNFDAILILLTIITGLITLLDVFLWSKNRPKAAKVPAVINTSKSLFAVLSLILVIHALMTVPFIDFPLILLSATGISGLIYLVDVIFFSKKRQRQHKEMPLLIDYARSFFPILLIVLGIRSFVIQPFRVPTGSLEPTVLPNDFVLVNQFAYGLRFPVWNKKILSIGEPKRGDIAVFRYPVNPHLDYIKRVIGLPGDHIEYKNKTLTVNGQLMPQTFLDEGVDFEPPNSYVPVKLYQENLDGITHHIFRNPKVNNYETFDINVPQGHYFVMGDNRDNSLDSRAWGFVPEENLVGKAFLIWFSFGDDNYRIRWNRIGTTL